MGDGTLEIPEGRSTPTAFPTQDGDNGGEPAKAITQRAQSESPNTDVGGHTAPSMSDAWGSSPEASAVRRFLTWLVTLSISSIAVAGAGLWLYQNEQRSNAREAEGLQDAARKGVQAADFRVDRAEDAVSSAESSIRFRSTYASAVEDRQLEASLAAARRELDEARSELSKADVSYNVALGRSQTSSERARKSGQVWLPYSVISLLVVGVAFLFARLYLAERHQQFENRIHLEQLEQQERLKAESFNAQGLDPLDINTLWDLNRARLEGYHRLVTDFASSTRQFTQLALTVGFAFLLGAMGIALFVRSAAASVATSVVATLGAALGGFVARTVLRNSEASAREVRAFFAHPLQLERYLAAERLLREMPEPEKAQGTLLIVKSLVRMEPDQIPEPPALASGAGSAEERA